MKSDDGKDLVTLENYSTEDPNQQDTTWTFDMYGTQKKDQSFH